MSEEREELAGDDDLETGEVPAAEEWETEDSPHEGEEGQSIV